MADLYNCKKETIQKNHLLLSEQLEKKTIPFPIFFLKLKKVPVSGERAYE